MRPFDRISHRFSATHGAAAAARRFLRALGSGAKHFAETPPPGEPPAVLKLDPDPLL
jgi:hypothetical protein